MRYFHLNIPIPQLSPVICCQVIRRFTHWGLSKLWQFAQEFLTSIWMNESVTLLIGTDFANIMAEEISRILIVWSSNYDMPLGIPLTPCDQNSTIYLICLQQRYSPLLTHWIYCSLALSHRYFLPTSYREITWSVETAKFGFILFQLLWNLKAPRQQCCPDACQIAERYDHYNIQSCGFETY